jgi:hypothetical protein
VEALERGLSFMPKKKKPVYKPYPISKLADNLTSYSYGQVWHTLDGQVIPLINLRNSHLDNIIIHVMKRRVSGGILPFLLAEKERRRKQKLIKKSKAGKILYGRK